ncbi:MAG: DUF4124 domain-containing protein [Syntrophaceae bacterium]|nr:DUF4124 domain-containing protein [Syntrophaceae bacterium]
MGIKKEVRSCILLATFILFFLECPAQAKELYRWIDEKGTVHFSDDGSSVPEKYRNQIEKKPVEEEVTPPREKGKARRQEDKGAKGRLATSEKEEIHFSKIEGDVTESFKTILSIWKDGKYDMLYDHGDQKSRMAVNREEFSKRMKKKGIGLASSWETVRDIQVEVKNATHAYVTARIGFKPTKGGETKFRTEIYPLSFEKGMWKINLLKILNVKI